MPHNAMIMTSKERRSLESKLSRLAPTPKQMDLIERIITHYGMKRVAMYFFDRFPTGHLLIDEELPHNLIDFLSTFRVDHYSSLQYCSGNVHGPIPDVSPGNN